MISTADIKVHNFKKQDIHNYKLLPNDISSCLLERVLHTTGKDNSLRDLPTGKDQNLFTIFHTLYKFKGLQGRNVTA